jgi:hypothetical protein
MTASFRFAALAIVMGSVLLVAPMDGAAQKPRAERPAYALGDRWIRSDGIFDLIRMDSEGYVFATEDGREIYLTKDLVITQMTRRGELEWALEPAPGVSWPLEVGKWGTRARVTRPTTYTPQNLTWKVEAFEEIRVPAGTFKAFRVQIAFGVGQITQWYAPDAKQVIKAVATFGTLSYSGSPARFPSFEVLAVDGLPSGLVTGIPPGDAGTRHGGETSPSQSIGPTAPPREPVEVLISSPVDQARVERDSVTLAGVVSGSRGLARVVVSLNGAEVSRIEGRTPTHSVPLGAALNLVEGSNTLVVTVVTPGGTVHQTIRTIHYERPAPLAIVVRYPVDGSKASEESSVVAAVVSSSRGIDRVTVALNGTEIHQQQEKGRPKSVVVTVPVKLRDGANTVVVSATAADGQTAQELRALVLERPVGAGSAAGVQSPLKLPARDRWAVVIGVGRYESDGIPKLKYAVSDAEAIYQILIASAGFKKEHVLLLTDKTERKPTLRTIRWALGTFLSRSAKKDDTVLIFFAGHGAPEIDPRGVERDGLAKYLIPIDADPDDLYSSAFPMDELQTVFGRIEAERVVAFLDACYSGTAGGRTFSSRRTRTGSGDDVFLERLTRSRGRAIMTASRPSEVSIEVSELGHGLFTYYLLQGLKGGGDLNRDGIVSLQELYEYVEQQVAGKSRALGGNQHPVMKGEMEGALPLIRLGPSRQ